MGGTAVKYILHGAFNPDAAKALMRDHGFGTGAMLYLIAWQNKLQLEASPAEGISPLSGMDKSGKHMTQGCAGNGADGGTLQSYGQSRAMRICEPRNGGIMTGIYKITNLVTGQFYIGQSILCRL